MGWHDYAGYLTVASRMGANFQSSKGVVLRVGSPAREGAASAFLNSLGVLSMACARTVLTALEGTAGRAALRPAVAWREDFIEAFISEVEKICGGKGDGKQKPKA